MSNSSLRPKVAVFLEQPVALVPVFALRVPSCLGTGTPLVPQPSDCPERLFLTSLKRLAPSPSAVTSLYDSLHGFDHHLKLCYYLGGYFLLSALLVKLSCINIEDFYNLFYCFILRAWYGAWHLGSA